MSQGASPPCRPRLGRLSARLAAGLAWGLLASAQAEPLSWSGEMGVAVWSSNRRLDDRNGVAVAHARAALEAQPTEGLQLRLEGWGLHETGAPAEFSGGWKEAFVELRSLPCQPSLGKRVVSWGKTDVFTPTDQLSPSDLTRLVAKDTDQRDGVLGLHGSCRLGPGRLAWHLLTHFKPSRVPLRATPGVRYVSDTGRTEATRALRWEVAGGAVDWAMSAIRGHDLMPTLGIQQSGAEGMVLQLHPSEMRLLGADAAGSLGEWVLRGEVAHVDYPAQSPRAGLLADATRSPYTLAVLAAEHGLGDEGTLTLQLYDRRMHSVPQPASPLQAQLQQWQGLLSNELDRQQYGISLRYAAPFAESKGDADLLLVWSAPRHDWYLRSRVNYSLSDALKLTLGAELLRGPANAYLGNLRQNSLAFAQLTLAW